MFCSNSDLYFQALRWLSLEETNILLRLFRNLDCHCFFAQTLHKQRHHVAVEGKRKRSALGKA